MISRRNALEVLVWDQVSVNATFVFIANFTFFVQGTSPHRATFIRGDEGTTGAHFYDQRFVHILFLS